MSFPLSEYTKIDVGWGFAPDPSGRAYSAPPDPWLVSRGPLHCRGEWRGGEERTRGRGREGKGRMGKGGKEGSWGNSALVVEG